MIASAKGGLQAYAYAGFDPLYGDGAIYEVACIIRNGADYRTIC
jgi:hypothetical protein